MQDGEEVVVKMKKMSNGKVRVYGKMKTNPTKKDSDGDGLMDNQEIRKGTTVIAPVDPKPMSYNGDHNMWKIHIRAMQSRSIATAYVQSDREKALKKALEKCKNKKIIKKAKNLAEDQARIMMIENMDDLDQALKTHEKSLEKFFELLKKKAKGDAAAVAGALLLGFQRDNLNQAYHSVPDTWQKNYGYNKLYDDVFEAASSMNTQSVDFNYNNEAYRLWTWSGDYWNLGTGAEIGLYKQSKESNAHYDAVNFNMPMQISLYDYSLGSSKKTYFMWDPNVRQWWTTGFDWNSTNPNKWNLLMVGNIDLSQMGDMKSAVSNAIKKDNNKKKYSDIFMDRKGKLWLAW